MPPTSCFGFLTPRLHVDITGFAMRRHSRFFDDPPFPVHHVTTSFLLGRRPRNFHFDSKANVLVLFPPQTVSSLCPPPSAPHPSEKRFRLRWPPDHRSFRKHSVLACLVPACLGILLFLHFSPRALRKCPATKRISVRPGLPFPRAPAARKGDALPFEKRRLASLLRPIPLLFHAHSIAFFVCPLSVNCLHIVSSLPRTVPRPAPSSAPSAFRAWSAAFLPRRGFWPLNPVFWDSDGWILVPFEMPPFFFLCSPRKPL